MRHDPRRQHGAQPGPAVGELAGEGPRWPTASGPRRRRAAVPGRPGARAPAGRRPGPVPHPDRVAQHGPAVGRAPPGARRGPRPRDRRARPLPTARGTPRTRRTARAGGRRVRPRGRRPRCRGAPAGSPRRPGRPAGRRAAADSAVRVRPMTAGSAPGCDASPSVTAISRSRTPAAARIAIVPPAPRTSSSGWAAITATLGQAEGSADGRLPEIRPRAPGFLRGAGPVDPVRREPGHHVTPRLVTSAPSSARLRSA